MDSFSPEQRWTSEAEPELGVGIVTKTSRGRVEINFPLSGDTRLYSTESAPLRRVKFKSGDTVVDGQGHSLVVTRVEEEDNLLHYFGKGGHISEANLGDVSITYGAEDKLLMGDVESPYVFTMRRQTLENEYRRQISPIQGFVGGRIDLIPHQLYIAQEVSNRYAPRVLLSDEVGLGKTIEACLILHRLLLSGRISRIMILVPESLVHQWFVELLRRFNMWFHIFDEERCIALDDSAPDGNPFLDDQLVLCSTDFLTSSPKRALQAQASGWDMLVVDEAHHLQWSVEEASTEYQIVEFVSQAAEGLLLLTATPEQLGLESHFARLRLLDPDRYSDFDAFQNESQDHQGTADLVEKLAAGQDLSPSDKELLANYASKPRLEAVAKGNEAARNHLIQDLLDQHGPGRVIFRNTRAAMSGFPSRKAHLTPLKAEAEETLARITQEFATDLNPLPGEPLPLDFTQDERLAWLDRFIAKIAPAKVLLICKTKEKVLALEEALRTRFDGKVGVFHEELTLVQRDRNAAWFSEPEGARVLLCSEIGSEGRNFQFAHHLVLLDLPVQPELLEQRIGRLDRIGQTEDINIHIPYIEGSPQEVLVKWYHEGLNAFEKNLEGGNKIAQQFKGRLLEVAENYAEPAAQKELADLIAETKAFHTQLETTLANGRDRLLEMNSFRPAVADQLIEQIVEEDQSPALETYMLTLFDQFNLEMEDLAPQTYLLKVPQGNHEAFPSIPDEGMTVTFDRKRALVREDITFLSWDHPMVTGVIDLVQSSGLGSSCFGSIPGNGDPAILLEAIYVLETSGAYRKKGDRFLPSTPIRVVVDHRGIDVTEDYPVETLDQRLRPGVVDDLLDNEMVAETILPRMLESALEIADDRGNRHILKGLQQMNRTLDHEIGRLEMLQQKNNGIRQSEIEVATEEQTQLSDLIKDARIRLDALQLIQKGNF